ncbi:MAG: hypothetical protein WAX69_19900 [Victivallales bacterium]
MQTLQKFLTGKLCRKLTYGKSSLDVIYSTYKGIPGIYADIKVKWMEHRKILKMEIKTEGEDSPHIYGFHDPARLNPADPQLDTDMGRHVFNLSILPCQKLDADYFNSMSEVLNEPFAVVRES